MSRLEKILIYGGLFVLAISVCVVYFVQQPQQIIEKTIIEKEVGAVPGPDIYSDYINMNGVEYWPTSQIAKKATTTICAIKSPSSTSTLVYGALNLSVGTSTTSIIDFARATTAYATTTKIGNTFALGAASGVFLLASTTPSTGTLGTPIIFPPSNWLVIKMVGSGDDNGSDAVSPTGVCEAMFVKID